MRGVVERGGRADFCCCCFTRKAVGSKKAEEASHRHGAHTPCPNVERRYSTFQTKQVFFTRRDAAQATSKNSEGCAKRERRHAPHASHRAQARRTRPSSSLPAPKQCSGNASRAQVNVNSTGAPGGRLDQESRDHIPPGHLERVQFSLQWGCNEVCQARAHRGRAPARILKTNLYERQAVCRTAVLPRQLGAAHAAMLTCASLWAAVCCTYSVWPCG